MLAIDQLQCFWKWINLLLKSLFFCEWIYPFSFSQMRQISQFNGPLPLLVTAISICNNAPQQLNSNPKRDNRISCGLSLEYLLLDGDDSTMLHFKPLIQSGQLHTAEISTFVSHVTWIAERTNRIGSDPRDGPITSPWQSSPRDRHLVTGLVFEPCNMGHVQRDLDTQQD